MKIAHTWIIHANARTLFVPSRTVLSRGQRDSGDKVALSSNNRGNTAVRARSYARRSSRGPLFYVFVLGVLAAAAGGVYWYQTRPTVPRAEKFLDMGQTQEGVAMLELLARKGNTDASLLLGNMFHAGASGVRQNHARAVPHLRAAADAGHDEARIRIGQIAYNGTAGQSDYPLALRYLMPLENSRNPVALSILGRMFFFGQGVEKDVGKAFTLLEKANSLGDKDAAAVLGRIYYEGLAGVPVDYEKANEYLARTPPGLDKDIDFLLGRMFFLGLSGQPAFRRAAERLENPELADNPEAQYYLGMLDFLGGARPPDFTAAKEHLDKAIEGGIKAANYPLAMMYYRGDIGEGVDYEQALEHVRIAVGAGDADAKALLGEMYYYGRGVRRDYDQAAKYLLESVRDEETEEKKYNYLLGRLYYYGHGIDQDYDKAAAHVMHAAGMGNLEAKALLANMYYYGRGVNQNLDSALFYLKDGLKANVPGALSLRGRMYYYGDADEWSDEKAVELLDAAAKAGDEDAAALLRERSMRESEKEKLKEELKKEAMRKLQSQ